ncbi:DUF2127 domain-containing protein [Agarivorans sp. QJM3NY_25]|uniref:DUF2127 domain-containing protein n=1 Tax=Agarivorans sp. QJM3NY_25 TaxID=3421430 RepID=UPI003D7ECF31
MLKIKKGLRAVAMLEACKGSLSFIVALGLFQLAGENLQQVLLRLLEHLHFNPASHFASILLHDASLVTEQNLHLVLIGSLVYTMVRFIEAYGLWHGFVWTEWFALLSGAIYLPFEIYELLTQQNLLSVVVLLLNLAIVLYMYQVLQHSRNRQFDE